MKYFNFLKSFVVLSGLAFLLNGCEKTPVTAPIGDAGPTYMKFLEAPENVLFFSPFMDVKTVDLFSIRKEPNSNKSLNTTSKAVITSLPDYITQYNTDHGTDYKDIPDSIFTLQNPAFVKTATGYDVNFAAGDFAKEFTIALNGAKWDITKSYVKAFGLSASDGNILYPSLDTILVVISIKNAYDGIYSYSGSIERNSASGPDLVLGGSFTNLREVPLPTLSTTSVGIVPLWADGNGVGGIANTILTVDPATNLVTVTSSNATLKNTVGSVNKYDPATKTFTLAFDWGVAPSTRATKLTLKYVKAR